MLRALVATAAGVGVALLVALVVGRALRRSRRLETRPVSSEADEPPAIARWKHTSAVKKAAFIASQHSSG